MTFFDESNKDPNRNARICFGHTWNLCVPMQNLENGSRTILEFRRTDSDLPLGWTYICLGPDSRAISLPEGLSKLCVLSGPAPFPINVNDSSPGSPASYPPLPNSEDCGLILNVECIIQTK